jgi:hypothetical protein
VLYKLNQKIASEEYTLFLSFIFPFPSAQNQTFLLSLRWTCLKNQTFLLSLRWTCFYNGEGLTCAWQGRGFRQLLCELLPRPVALLLPLTPFLSPSSLRPLPAVQPITTNSMQRSASPPLFGFSTPQRLSRPRLRYISAAW